MLVQGTNKFGISCQLPKMDAFTNGRVWHYSSLIIVIGYKRTDIQQPINIAFLK